MGQPSDSSLIYSAPDTSPVPNWFHVFLRLRTKISVLLLVALWTALIVIIADLYCAVDRKDAEVRCGLGPAGDPISFHGAFTFSLETATTVGYGIPNGGNFFFENCPLLQVAIYFQMVVTIFFNGFIFSFVYSRMGDAFPLQPEGHAESRGHAERHSPVRIVRALVRCRFALAAVGGAEIVADLACLSIPSVPR